MLATFRDFVGECAGLGANALVCPGSRRNGNDSFILRSPAARRPRCGRPGTAAAAWQAGSAAPCQQARADRVVERSALGAGASVFALQAVVPFRLGVGVVDQQQRRVESKALLLTQHDGAVLPQEGAGVAA